MYPRLFFRHRWTSPSAGTQREWWDTPSRAVDALDPPLSFPPEVNLSSLLGPGTSPEHLVDAVQSLGPFLPVGCELLGQGDLKILGPYPIDAGGFADVWVGEKADGTKVAVKSYRCYSSSNCLPILFRLYKEVMTYSRFNDNDKSFVPFIGVYSTLEHPLALIFEFMDHQNLREYLRNNSDVGRLQLLLETARGLQQMHSLGVVNGNFKITDVLVDNDGHARIAGLGSASIPSTMPTVDVDRPFPYTAPELIDPQRWGIADTSATMASDVYAFGIFVWEVFSGRLPFSDESVIAGIQSTVNGRRPVRPEHPEVSNRVWKMIQGCWKGNPTRRMTMTDVVAALEASR